MKESINVVEIISVLHIRDDNCGDNYEDVRRRFVTFMLDRFDNGRGDLDRMINTGVVQHIADAFADGIEYLMMSMTHDNVGESVLSKIDSGNKEVCDD